MHPSGYGSLQGAAVQQVDARDPSRIRPRSEAIALEDREEEKKKGESFFYSPFGRVEGCLTTYRCILFIIRS